MPGADQIDQTPQPENVVQLRAELAKLPTEPERKLAGLEAAIKRGALEAADSKPTPPDATTDTSSGAVVTTPKLTQDAAHKIGIALRRKHQLSSELPTDERTAEARGLDLFLGAELLKYANELIGGWFVLRNEYQPLIVGVAGILRRTLGNIEAPAQVQQPAQ